MRKLQAGAPLRCKILAEKRRKADAKREGAREFWEAS